MKRILSVQDLSCVGKCSLTVALPVISAMGVEAAVLPTAVLSTHTAFPSPAVQDLTGQMEAFCAHWQQVGVTFDGICAGYLSSPEQAGQVLRLAEQFRKPGSFLLVDPVMGDNGKLYDRITPEFAEKMRHLCARADVIVPNLTEACFLTDTPYPVEYDEGFIRCLLKKLTDSGCRVAMITGIAYGEDTTGVAGYEGKTDTYRYISHQKLPQSYHGTGDIFCAVCAGALALGKDWQEAASLAGEFTLECIRLTAREPRDKRYGVCFEKALPQLMEKLQ